MFNTSFALKVALAPKVLIIPWHNKMFIVEIRFNGIYLFFNVFLKPAHFGKKRVDEFFPCLIFVNQDNLKLFL